jgi:hypothetical protein
MTKTRKELLALAELAKAATPGPWEFNKDPDDYVCTIRAAISTQ